MVKNAIKVYARLKPEEVRKNVANYQIYSRPKEHLEEDFLVLSSPRKATEFIDHRPESWSFSFFRIFEESATQNDIFENVAQPVVHSALDGYNATVFAYGQTGSGKTYTITGDQKKYDARGIIPRTLQYLFNVIRKHPENVYSVEVAYLEIYNENGYDLLDRKHRREFVNTRLEDLPRVTIQEDEAGVLHLKNLTFHSVGSEQDAFELLLVGDANRVTADTPMNPESSRSHCIFTIIVSTKQFSADRYSRSKMHFVDLAGSERVYKCAITGTILTEAKHINLSLHYLEQVIVCLGQESTGHVPYRNSLLTAILRDSLGGNCYTTMLATLSVSSFNFEETISTCRFAQRVALIKNDVNLVLERDIESENMLLRLENERLKRQIEALTKPNMEIQLSIEEKETLDSQIRRFLDTDSVISWDYDSRKVRYCFEAFKKNILLSRNGDNCLQKLENYKNMVINRDKEISLLINMLKKERRKQSNTIIDRGMEHRESSPDRRCKEIIPAEETSNLPESKECRSQLIEKLIMDKLPFSETMLEHQSTNGERKTTFNDAVREELREDSICKTNNIRKEKVKISRKKHRLSSDSTKRNSSDSDLLPCNIVNLTLHDSTNIDNKGDKTITIGHKSHRQHRQPDEKPASKEFRNEEISVKLDTDFVQNTENPKNLTSQLRKSHNDQLCKTFNPNAQIDSLRNKIRNTFLKPKLEVFKSNEPFYFEKCINFNISKDISSDKRNECEERKGTNDNVELQNDSKVDNKGLRINCASDHSTKLTNSTLNKQDIRYLEEVNTEHETFKYHNKSEESEVCNRTAMSQSPSVFANSEVKAISSTEQSECKKDKESCEESLPLTGDPEIDEEIIAFYKAKRTGGTY